MEAKKFVLPIYIYSNAKTAVALVGMILGLVLTPVVSGNYLAVWTLFFVFTFLHLYANYNAVSCVVFDTLNQQRASIVIRKFVENKRFFDVVLFSEIRVPTRREVSKEEKIFVFDKKNRVFGGKVGDLPVDKLSMHKYVICADVILREINFFLFRRKVSFDCC
jgi:hypothetical protein